MMRPLSPGCESGEEGHMSERCYDRHILPYLIELACGNKAFSEQREKVVPLARGRVLEVGIGTGLNIPHYDKSKGEKIIGLDTALHMHRLARRRIARAGLPVELIGLSAEKVPLDDASIDTVLVVHHPRSRRSVEGNAPRPRARRETDFLRTRPRTGRERPPLAGQA